MTTETKITVLTTLVKLAAEKEQLRDGAAPDALGTWTKRRNGWGYACSECSGIAPMQYRYCPHCGYEMNGGNKNE
ncbi:MAG: hypothetical protein IJN43_18760 [Ruminococcus sp.]|nr:hypothetical protein [Ruminococcus sp.]